MSARPLRRVGIAVESSLWGGLETHALDLAGVLAASGYQAVILCSSSHTLKLFQSKTDLELAPMPPFSTGGVVALVRAFRRLAIDACVFEKGTLHAASLAFDVAARLACERYITVQQLAPPVLPPPSARRALGVPSPNLWRHRMMWRGRLRSLLPHVTVCVSDAVSHALREDYQFAETKLVTVRNGVDVERFREDPEGGVALRARWGIPESAMLFGAVCRLVPEKGLDVCLEAFARLVATAHRPVHLVIVGDGPERQALQAMVVDRGLQERVRLEDFRTDVPTVLSALDVLVLSSRMEGLPLIVLEALAVGRPVIATRVAGTPEIFTREGLGWLVSPGDPAGLFDAMHAAASLPPERIEAMRVTARQHAVERFNAPVEYARIVSLVCGRS